MSLAPPNNCASRLLYLLYIVILLALSLAKTITADTNILSEDNLSLENGELAVEQPDSVVTRQNLSDNKARSLKCVPMIKYFEVLLRDVLRPGEGVGLTGDHPKLGEWQFDKSLEMKRKRRNRLKWYLKIAMCSESRIYYRFFIYYKDTQGVKRLRWWESQQHARVLEAYEVYRHQGPHTFGQAHPLLAMGGGGQIERPWLRKEYIIQLKFIWPQHISFTKFSHFLTKPKYLLTLKALPDAGNIVRLPDDIEIHVSRFGDKQSELKTLSIEGVAYQPGDIVVFHITLSEFWELSFVLAIHTREQELLGEVVIAAKAIKCSEGILELPILDVQPKQQPQRVGWLTLPFLRIEAMPQALKLNMRASFHHYWPLNWPTLDIGHRGVGKSFHHHSASAWENTIDSFLQAKDVKSDMILLNVQLTKDYVPVVWHDFGFFTAASSHPTAQKLKAKDLAFVHIHDLTYRELAGKRIFMFIKGTLIEMTHYNRVGGQPKKIFFPQLAQVYEQLPANLGLIIDIKWPQLLSSGSFESLQTLDKNLYVDAVLKTSMEFGCGRPLIMASFDADICTMLRFKQHMFGVIFLTAGLNSPWPNFADARTHSPSSALQFVQASDILGSAIYATEIMPSQNSRKALRMAFELQQVVFVWGGEQLQDAGVQEHFRNEEMAGLIYDQIDSVLVQKPQKKRKRFGFFEAEELQRIFLRQCMAAGNLSLKDGPPDTHSPFWPRLRSLDEL